MANPLLTNKTSSLQVVSNYLMIAEPCKCFSFSLFFKIFIAELLQTTDKCICNVPFNPCVFAANLKYNVLFASPIGNILRKRIR